MAEQTGIGPVRPWLFDVQRRQRSLFDSLRPFASLFADAAAEFLNLRTIYEAPRHPDIAENSLVLTGVVANIVGESLPDNDTAQDFRACIPDRMRQATLSIADEIALADGELFVPDYSGCRSAQYEDALILVIVEVVLCRLMARLDFDDMEAEPG